MKEDESRIGKFYFLLTALGKHSGENVRQWFNNISKKCYYKQDSRDRFVPYYSPNATEMKELAALFFYCL